MRVVRLGAVIALALGVVGGSAAQAASPASGKLLDSKRVMTWSGGPFVASEPNYVSADCRYTVRLSSRVYGKILDAIERNGYDALSRRANVPFRRKLAALPVAFVETHLRAGT